MSKEYIQIMNGLEVKSIVSLDDQHKISDSGLYSMCVDYNNLHKVYTFEIKHGIKIECNKEIKDTLESKLPPNLKMDITTIGIDRYLILFLEDDKEYVCPIATATVNNDGSIRWEYTQEHFDYLKE